MLLLLLGIVIGFSSGAVISPDFTDLRAQLKDLPQNVQDYDPVRGSGADQNQDAQDKVVSE